MRSLCPVIERKTGSGVGIVLIVVIDTHIAGNLRLRFQSRTLGADIDNTIERRRTVKHRRSTFHHLHLRHILQRHVIPVDLTGLGVEDGHTVHQHLATGTDTVGPTTATADRRLLVNHFHTGKRLKSSRQVRRSLTAKCFRLNDLYRHRHIRHSLLKSAGGNNDLVQHLIVRLHHQIECSRNGFEHLLLRLITDIGELDMRRQRCHLERKRTVKIRDCTAVIIQVQNGNTDKRLTRKTIRNHTGQSLSKKRLRHKD